MKGGGGEIIHVYMWGLNPINLCGLNNSSIHTFILAMHFIQKMVAIDLLAGVIHSKEGHHDDAIE